MRYLMFASGLFPILLVYALLAFLIAAVAKKFGKSFWTWSIISLLLMVIATWDKLPSWSAKVFYNASVATQNEHKGKLISLSEARDVMLSASIDGVSFDVPLTYELRSFNRQDRGWYGIAPGQMDGTQRPAVDFINIWGLLPDLEPMNKKNLVEFEKPGYRKVVPASLTHIRPWDYYFKNTFPRVERQPESPNVPGMLYYYDPLAHHHMYLSHDHAVPDLTRITCNDQKFRHVPSPACEVETSYRPSSELIVSEHIEGAIFRLEYHFASQYLSQWREIDRKLKAHFDQFIRNAHPSSNP